MLVLLLWRVVFVGVVDSNGVCVGVVDVVVGGVVVDISMYIGGVGGGVVNVGDVVGVIDGVGVGWWRCW